MNAFHREILEEIKKLGDKDVVRSWNAKYLGNIHPIYSVSIPKLRAVLKSWSSRHKDISLAEFINLVNSFYEGKSYEEVTAGGLLLGYFPKLRKQLGPEHLDRWLTYVQGWAETDALCQGNFTAENFLANWKEWQKALKRWSCEANVHKRRASLVLLTGPVAHSTNERLTDIAFENIDRLKDEKDILITKAVSWLLRSIVRKQPDLVKRYLDKNEKSLPPIAVRETRNKLKSGRKSGH